MSVNCGLAQADPVDYIDYAAVGAGANALSQVVIRGGKVNWQQVATDTILNFVQNRGQSIAQNKNAELIAQQRRELGIDNEQLYSTAPKGAFTRELLSSQAVEAAAIPPQLGLNGTAPKAGGLDMSYPFTPDQYMKDDNAATTAAYFKQLAKENAVNKVRNQVDAVNGQKTSLISYRTPDSSGYGDFLFSGMNFINSSGSTNVGGNLVYKDSLGGRDAINFAKSYNAKTTAEKIGTFIAGGIDSGMLGLLNVSNALISDPIDTLKNGATGTFDLIADISGSAFGNEYSQRKLNERMGPLLDKAQAQYGAGDYYNLGTNFPISTTGGLVGLNSFVTKKALFSTPQGISRGQFNELSSTIRARASELGLGDDISVQGSRASHQAMPNSDLDIIIRVSPERFEDFLLNQSKFKSPNLSPSNQRGLEYAIENGKIARGEAGFKNVGKLIQNDLGVNVEISVIRAGSKLDNGQMIPLAK